VGMIGWMSETCRPDLKYSHSRLGAYLQFPTENAWKMLIRTTCYAARKPHLGIRTPRWWVKEDPIYDPLPTDIEQQQAWRFYSDSDHAGNTETSNRYKSHWGGLATLGGAPVLFVARSTGVAMAHPDMDKDGHADTSSAAVEVYAAGNMTHEMLHLSYVAEDMGIKFPKPAILQVDNDACKLFILGETKHTKLKHIYTRQSWVRSLRDANIIIPRHVPSKLNPADIFTKPVKEELFCQLRHMFMHDCHPNTIDAISLPVQD
jgi:hypothetical protein